MLTAMCPMFAALSPEAQVVLITAFVSFLIGVVLYWFATRGRMTAVQQQTQPKSSLPPTETLPAVMRELDNIALPPAQRAQVAAALSQVVSKQVESSKAVIATELTRKFEQTLQKKSEEVLSIRKQYRETLTVQRQTEAVMKSVAEGVVVVDKQGKVVFMNPAAERLLGVTSAEQMNKPLKQSLKDEQMLSLVKDGSTSEQMEIELNAHEDQTKRVLRSSNAIVSDQSGKTVGMVSVLSDVTKQKELDGVKAQFMSNVTHELRTPIVAVQHALDLVDYKIAKTLPEDQRKYLDIARRNIKRLDRLVDDLLDLAKLEAGKLTLKCEVGPVQPVVQRACEALDAWSKSKQVEIGYHVADGLPDISMDPGRIEQVLNNLLSNALKFTPEQGRVTVTAGLADGAVQVSVQDTGCGIAKEDLLKLFQKFSQVGEQSKNTHGTGLGLAISREIVGLHGGRIWVDSEMGKGSTFSFALPTAIPPATEDNA